MRKLFILIPLAGVLAGCVQPGSAASSYDVADDYDAGYDAGWHDMADELSDRVDYLEARVDDLEGQVADAVAEAEDARIILDNHGLY